MSNRHVIKFQHRELDTGIERYYAGNGKFAFTFDTSYVYIDDAELDADIEYLNSPETVTGKAGFQIIVLREVMNENRHREWINRDILKDVDDLGTL